MLGKYDCSVLQAPFGMVGNTGIWCQDEKEGRGKICAAGKMVVVGWLVAVYVLLVRGIPNEGDMYVAELPCLSFLSFQLSYLGKVP